jgi:hypothetical protein
VFFPFRWPGLQIASALPRVKGSAAAKIGGKRIPCKVRLEGDLLGLDLGALRTLPEGAVLEIVVS